jgi:hypothetical protein
MGLPTSCNHDHHLHFSHKIHPHFLRPGRHTVSAAFAVHFDGTEKPIPSDDVKSVERIHISNINLLTLFADQKTVVQDYLRLYYDSKKKTAEDFKTSYEDFAPDIQRSICVPFNVA